MQLKFKANPCILNFKEDFCPFIKILQVHFKVNVIRKKDNALSRLGTNLN